MTKKLCEHYGSLCRYPNLCGHDYCHRWEFDGFDEMEKREGEEEVKGGKKEK